MAIAAIHDWLAARGTFSLGVELLKQHGSPTKSDLFIFSLPESPVTRQRLIDRLSKLNERATASLVAHESKAIAAVAEFSQADRKAFDRTLVAESATDPTPGSLPPELRELQRDLARVHREMMHLKGIILKTPDGSELQTLAEKLVELDERNAAGWRRIEYWRETGHVLQENVAPAPVVLDIASAKLRRNALRVWFSQRSPKAKNPRPYTPEDWAAKENEMKELNRIIDGPGEDQ